MDGFTLDLNCYAGEGGFATVRKGRHRITQNTYAIKTIDIYKIKADQLDSLRNEITIMKMLDHPNVIKLYETFEEENKLHLVLELCEGGDLFDFITKTSIEAGQLIWYPLFFVCARLDFLGTSYFYSSHTRIPRRSNGNVSFVWTEARLAEVFRKMLSAVAYLHQRGIAHRLASFLLPHIIQRNRPHPCSSFRLFRAHPRVCLGST
jgi:serine/threonine protein kinase